jgi:hypothetical protein
MLADNAITLLTTGNPAKRGAQTLSQWGSMACGMHARKSGEVVCFDMTHPPFSEMRQE